MRTGGKQHQIGRRGVAAAAFAAVANTGIYLGGRAADVSFVVPAFDGGNPMQIPLGQVVFVTVTTILLGTGVALLVARLGRVVLARGAAVVVTLLSLGAPLSIDTAASTKLLLALMHVVTGAAFSVALRHRSGVEEQLGESERTSSGNEAIEARVPANA